MFICVQTRIDLLTELLEDFDISCVTLAGDPNVYLAEMQTVWRARGSGAAVVGFRDGHLIPLRPWQPWGAPSRAHLTYAMDVLQERYTYNLPALMERLEQAQRIRQQVRAQRQSDLIEERARALVEATRQVQGSITEQGGKK